MGGGIFTQGVSSLSESKSGVQVGVWQDTSLSAPSKSLLKPAPAAWVGLQTGIAWSASTRFPRRSIGLGGMGSRGWHPQCPPGTKSGFLHVYKLPPW